MPGDHPSPIAAQQTWDHALLAGALIKHTPSDHPCLVRLEVAQTGDPHRRRDRVSNRRVSWPARAAPQTWPGWLNLTHSWSYCSHGCAS